MNTDIPLLNPVLRKEMSAKDRKAVMVVANDVANEVLRTGRAKSMEELIYEVYTAGVVHGSAIQERMGKDSKS